jgi:hypothetical protein
MEEYSPSLLKRIKRRTYGFCCGVTCLLSCTGLSVFTTCTHNPHNNDTADPDMSSTHPQTTQHPGYLTKLKTFISCIFVPCGLIVLDIGYSDISVIIALGSYIFTVTGTATTAQVFADVGINNVYTGNILVVMWLLLCLLYIVSSLSLVFTSFISTLRTSYQTALAMGNTEDEQAGTATPMGKI